MEETIPARIAGRSVWRKADFAGEAQWLTVLSDEETDEIDQALSRLDTTDTRGEVIDQQRFPLPRLSARLAAVAEEVVRGRGFHVIRGIPVDRYPVDRLRCLFFGIGSHFGTPVVQTREHDMMIDVRDENGTSSKRQRGYHSVLTLPFHTDGACIVGLLCINQAGSGGESLLVSAGALFNAIAEQSPELIEPLMAGFPIHRRGCEPVGEPPVSPWKLPVFSFTNGNLNCVYDYQASIWGEEAFRGRVTELQKRALDCFDRLTLDPQFQVSMHLKPGDIQLVNNFSVLHSRTSFQNAPDQGRVRHLLRLWLDVPGNERYAINKLHLYTSSPLPAGLVPTSSAA